MKNLWSVSGSSQKGRLRFRNTFKKATFEFQSMQAVFQLRFNFFLMLILEYVVSDQWGEKSTKKDFSTRIPKSLKLMVTVCDKP